MIPAPVAAEARPNGPLKIAETVANKESLDSSNVSKEGARNPAITPPQTNPNPNPQQAVPAPQAHTDPKGMPTVADDVDVIEQTWVKVAKRLLEANRNDPYKKAAAVSTMREDYQKKRFGFIRNNKSDK